MTPQKAVGYARVSTVAQAQHGESPQTQQDEITRFCESHGLELIEIFTDLGVSGRKQDRPGLNALLDGARRKEFDIVVVSRMTRFGRSAKDLLNNLGVLDDNHIKFASLKENLDTSTPAGRLLQTVLAGIAEFESEVIKSQMLENRHIRAKRGDIIIGKPPYGYAWNKEKKCMEVDPQEAEVYNRMVKMCLDGKSYKDITIALRKDGVKAKLALFSATVVGQILKNPCYYSGRLLRNTHVFKGNIKTEEMKPADQHFELKLPPLTDKLTWDRVQEKIAFNKVKTKRTTNPNFWLRNVLRCGECGGTVKPKSIRGRFDYYCCYWATSGKKFLEAAGKKCKCSLPSIPAQALQDRVMYHLLHFLTFGGFTIAGKYAPAKIERLLAPQKFDEQAKGLSEQLAQYKRALGRKTTARENLFTMLEEPGFDRAIFAQQMEKIGGEIQTLEAHIDDTGQRLAGLERARANHQDMVRFVKGNRRWLRGIADKIIALEPPEKQKLIESLLDGKITVEYDEETKTWVIMPPPFRFNPDALQALVDENAFNKVYNYQSGSGRHSQGWHRLRPACGGGHPDRPGVHSSGGPGELSPLWRALPGRPPQVHPRCTLHGPGHPGGKSCPHHPQGQRQRGGRGPGD